jgi:hypothetical protein
MKPGRYTINDCIIDIADEQSHVDDELMTLHIEMPDGRWAYWDGLCAWELGQKIIWLCSSGETPVVDGPWVCYSLDHFLLAVKAESCTGEGRPGYRYNMTENGEGVMWGVTSTLFTFCDIANHALTHIFIKQEDNHE